MRTFPTGSSAANRSTGFSPTHQLTNSNKSRWMVPCRTQCVTAFRVTPAARTPTDCRLRRPERSPTSWIAGGGLAAASPPEPSTTKSAQATACQSSYELAGARRRTASTRQRSESRTGRTSRAPCRCRGTAAGGNTPGGDRTCRHGSIVSRASSACRASSPNASDTDQPQTNGPDAMKVLSGFGHAPTVGPPGARKSRLIKLRPRVAGRQPRKYGCRVPPV